jgi:hypothetical protein
MSRRPTARTALLAATTALAAAGASTLLLAPAQAAPPEQAGKKLTTALTGAAEVPGPGDADGVGTASVNVVPGLGRICYSLEVSGIAPAAAAHIHVGAADVAGPVVQGLMPPTTGASSGCVTNRELAFKLVRDPGAYYVNVHNAEFPAGAVRGQLGG